MATEARTTSTGTIGTPTQWTMVLLTMSWLAGVIGSFLDEGADGQVLLYSLAAMGGAGAGALLAARHLRAGRDLAAAGFIGMVAWSLASSVAGYTGDGSTAVGVSLSVLVLPGMLLIAAQDWSPIWTRGAAAVAGIAFAIWGYKYLLGDDVPDIESPIIMVAYFAFAVASIGWTLTVRSEG